MTNLKKQIISAAAAGAMLLNVASPALAATEIVISGNGSGSDNWTDVSQKTETTVSQDNTANVTNTVNADAKTGGNDASFNTGGEVRVVTGDAKVNTSINNALNTNVAEVDCCEQGDTTVKIDGNGAHTDNTVFLDQKTKTRVNQDNTANVTNDVDADANTGKNDANKNTGGEVVIVTGNAKVNTDISTTANVNVAKVGAHLGSSNPSATFLITGNGAGSDNYIDGELKNYTKVDQDNEANITNEVDADAETGYNDAGFNTGGDVIIGTGNAKVNTAIDNSVNFNSADVDCGCTWDVLAKIAGNGAGGDHGWKWWNKDENVITLALENEQRLYQDNLANLTNDVNADAKTGKNDVESNTAEGDTDPAIITGDAKFNTSIGNSGNSNVVGDLFSHDLPEFPDMDVSFNMSVFWAMLSGMMN